MIHHSHRADPARPSQAVSIALSIDAPSAVRLADLVREAVEAAVARPRGAAGAVAATQMPAGVLPGDPGMLIDIKTLARLLSASPRHVAQLNVDQQIPEPVRLRRLVRWPLAEVQAWVSAGCPARREWKERRTGNKTTVG